MFHTSDLADIFACFCTVHHCPVLQLGPDSDHCGSCSVQHPTGASASEAALQYRKAMMEATVSPLDGPWEILGTGFIPLYV